MCSIRISVLNHLVASPSTSRQRITARSNRLAPSDGSTSRAISLPGFAWSLATAPKTATLLAPKRPRRSWIWGGSELLLWCSAELISNYAVSAYALVQPATEGPSENQFSTSKPSKASKSGQLRVTNSKACVAAMAAIWLSGNDGCRSSVRGSPRWLYAKHVLPISALP